MLVGISSFWGLLRILHSGEFKKYQETFLKYAGMLHLWPSLFGSPNKSSFMPKSDFSLGSVRKVCRGQLFPENSDLGRPLCLHGPGRKWNEYRWILHGLMGLIWLGYTFGRWRTLLVSIGCGLWKDLFWGGNIRSSQMGNSFKMEHWARKIINCE